MGLPAIEGDDRWSFTSCLLLALLLIGGHSLVGDVEAAESDLHSAVQALVERAADSFARRRGRRVGYRCVPDGPDRGSYTCESVSRDPALACVVSASGAACREVRVCVECAQ